MKTRVVKELQSLIEKRLQPLLRNPVTCSQYASWILQAVTGLTSSALLTRTEIPWHTQQQEMLEGFLDKLINQHMPLAYLLGSVPFCDLEILVEPPTLIPRPETEEWCARLIKQLQPITQEPLVILDLCTGSGCIGLALAKALPQAQVYAVDISEKALALAQKNATHNTIHNITFMHSDLFEQLPPSLSFDLLVSNPPYIPAEQWPTLEKSVTQWEDKNAFIAPDEGCALITRIIDEAPKYLRPNAILQAHSIAQLILEIDYTQGTRVADYMRAKGYTGVTCEKDRAGKDRVVCGSL